MQDRDAFRSLSIGDGSCRRQLSRTTQRQKKSPRRCRSQPGEEEGWGRGGDDFSFFDEASIYVRAGSGGQGSSTYKKAKKSSDGIPDGGAGGEGGSVILELDDSLNTLAGLSRRALRPNAFGGGGGAMSSKRLGRGSSVLAERLLSFRAENGRDGGRMYNNGRCGEDCVVRVPPGTVISYETEKVDRVDDDGREDIAGESDEGERRATTAKEYDLVEVGAVTFDNPRLLVAMGGRGGEGTASNRKNGKNIRQGSEGGERFRLRLTLKIVADLALVGVPNAGKSTFLASVTKAKPKIADYPFTTVVPNLGVWIPGTEYGTDHSSYNKNVGDNRMRSGEDTAAAGSNGVILCDVPGLIAGAADGVGLGHAFLRHVERCRVILHLVDATSQDPVGDYQMVNEEILKYGNGNLAKMPQVVVVNKIDIWEQETDHNDTGETERLRKELETELKSAMPHSRLMWMSAKERGGVDDLMIRMAAYISKVKEMAESQVESST